MIRWSEKQWKGITLNELESELEIKLMFNWNMRFEYQGRWWKIEVGGRWWGWGREGGNYWERNWIEEKKRRKKTFEMTWVPFYSFGFLFFGRINLKSTQHNGNNYHHHNNNNQRL